MNYNHEKYRQPHERRTIEDARQWLRERGRYALEVPYQTVIYKPVSGKPLEPLKG